MWLMKLKHHSLSVGIFPHFAHTILGKAYGKHATFPEVFLQSLGNNVSKHPFCYIEPAAVDTDF